MTSACIFKDALRNHTQAFLEFRNSILRFVYISSTWMALLTLYFHWRGAAAREYQTKSRLGKWTTIISNTHHSTNFYSPQPVASIILIQPIFLQLIIRSASRCHSVHQQTPRTLTYFMLSNYQTSPVRAEITRRTYSTLRSEQTIKRWGCHQSPRSHPLSLISWRSMMIPTRLQYLMGLGSSTRSFPQAWMI